MFKKKKNEKLLLREKTVKKMKTQDTNWQKIFVNHLPNKGLVSKTSKELFKFNKRQTTQLKTELI